MRLATMKALLPLPGLAVLLLARFAAGETPPPLPEGVPQAPSEADFEALRRTSPFTRVLSLPETYALRGVATIGGERVATLYNRETKKTIVATPDGGNEVGISLVEIVPAPLLDDVAAKIAFAGDEAELRYETSQIHPEPSPRPGTPSQAGGSSGNSRPRGPTPEEIERFRALPEEKQAKLREYIDHVRQNYPDMSREERGNLIRGAMMRLSDGHDIAIPAAPPQGQAVPGGGQPQGTRNSGQGESRRREGNGEGTSRRDGESRRSQQSGTRP